MNAQTREEGRCSLAAEALRSWGSVQLRATGISMLPTLWPGDLLRIESQTVEQIQPGDIVLYRREGRFFIHRVVSTSRPGGEPLLITRGDAMAQDDLPVQREQLLGKVTEIRNQGSRVVPVRELSLLQSVFAWMLCHWDFCGRVVLRLHAWRRSVDSAFDPTVPEAVS